MINKPRFSAFVNSKSAVVSVILLCFIWWGYLFFSSQMLIVHDACGYQDLGRLLSEKGWAEYFKTGPHREPLYPLLISISMRLGRFFGISYHYFQKAIQILFLFMTQMLLFFVMKKLKIHNAIILVLLLYFGLSPALVNAAFSLYSEIAAFPFVVLIVIMFIYSLNKLLGQENTAVVKAAVLTAVTFVLAVFSKGIFLYIFHLIMLAAFILWVRFCFKRNRLFAKKFAVYLFTTVFVFNLCVFLYMWMNKKFNGQFELTNRYAGAFFGVAYKRTNKLTGRILAAHVVSIPGWGACRVFFTEEECRYCEFYASDSYYMGATLQSRIQGLPKEKRNRATFDFAFERIKSNASAYILLTLIEAPKILFWESTKIGFVKYPDWLDKVYSNRLFKDGLRLTSSAVTAFSVLFAFFNLVKKRDLFFEDSKKGRRVQIMGFTIFIIFAFAGLYSLFLILTRYALPIVSLYFLCIAYSAQPQQIRSK